MSLIIFNVPCERHKRGQDLYNIYNKPVYTPNIGTGPIAVNNSHRLCHCTAEFDHSFAIRLAKLCVCVVAVISGVSMPFLLFVTELCIVYVVKIGQVVFIARLRCLGVYDMEGTRTPFARLFRFHMRVAE